MYPSKQQLSIQTNALSIQDSSASVQVDQKETSVVGMQNGGNPEAEAIFYNSQNDQMTYALLYPNLCRDFKMIYERWA
ncbi:hypothetical protein Patl1_05162 [Pistacia atlantica]|uniref:Uncharacterized protein n=1 Tax=Pistacia atlantica TaxID=434234 RepID=A0ACC1BX28_9ROSI|nr:hypothetical protein Patl1_05162 [Pistacia atlantica]